MSLSARKHDWTYEEMCDSLDAVYEENDLSNIETDNQIRKMFARASAIRPVILDSIQKKQLAFKSLSDSS